MNEFERYCLTFLDIRILELRDGTKNNIVLGADTNYFGTLINGTGRFTAPGTDFTIHEGETVFIPKSLVYCSEWRGRPNPKFYSLPFVFFPQGQEDIRFSLQKVGMPCVADYMEKMFEAKLRGEISAVFSKFYELYGLALPYLVSEKRVLVSASVFPAVRHIEANPDGDFDVPYLASLCGMSESNFYAVFKKQTGLTPVGYKNKIRCRRVSELLRNTDYTVEYISEKLGFSSPMYMRKILRKFTGKTPGEIRREPMLL